MNQHVEEAHGCSDEDDADDDDDDDADDDDARGTEARCHALASSGYPGSQLLQAAAAG